MVFPTEAPDILGGRALQMLKVSIGYGYYPSSMRTIMHGLHLEECTAVNFISTAPFSVPLMSVYDVSIYTWSIRMTNSFEYTLPQCRRVLTLHSRV